MDLTEAVIQNDAGKWLRRAGFELGQKVAVKVGDGRLTICAE